MRACIFIQFTLDVRLVLMTHAISKYNDLYSYHRNVRLSEYFVSLKREHILSLPQFALGPEHRLWSKGSLLIQDASLAG